MQQHPEVTAAVPSTCTLHVSRHTYASDERTRQLYQFWLQRKDNEQVIQRYNSMSVLKAALLGKQRQQKGGQGESKRATKNGSEMPSKDVNPFSRGKFISAIKFALKGEEKRRYVAQHPVLQRVPATHKLWIIAKDTATSSGVCSWKRITYWLQVSRPGPNLAIASLQPLPRTLARSFTGSPAPPSTTAPAPPYQSQLTNTAPCKVSSCLNHKPKPKP
jgi:hypothetical protein